jgi:AraC-like DNA-binding protein
MAYREHASPSALAPWLACAWERRGETGAPVRVLPDGCIDIVWIEGSGTQVIGANTAAFVVSTLAGTRVAGVRMRPGAGAALLGIDAGALRDGRIALADVWGDDGHVLEERVQTAADPVAALLAELCARAPRLTPPDPLVRAAVARLHDPRARVEALADELAVSTRQLRRRFETSVGYGPKRLARVLRLERALDAARAGEELALAAAGAGYADQAHFGHDCRALAGVAPSALLHH